MNGGASVVAVIVSYNRRELLLESVQAVLAQTRVPDTVVVVDNASADGSADAIRAATPGVDLLVLPRNVGGAGGFAVGLAHAVARHGADWVWLMDDDTVPHPEALDALLQAVERAGAVVGASRVLWTDGSDHPMNTPRQSPFASAAQKRAAAAAGGTAIRSTSFVSMLVRADVVVEVGLPVADYFIWNDDFEFSTRMLRGRPGLFVPASVAIHKTRLLGSTDLDPGPRFFYEVRNKVWLFTRSRCLSAGEKMVYGGSTLLRWARTFLRSADRRTLLSGLLRGARAGVARPRSNEAVLADLGEGTAAFTAFERLRARRA